jgi:hypothetical protein
VAWQRIQQLRTGLQDLWIDQRRHFGTYWLNLWIIRIRQERWMGLHTRTMRKLSSKVICSRGQSQQKNKVSIFDIYVVPDRSGKHILLESSFICKSAIALLQSAKVPAFHALTCALLPLCLYEHCQHRDPTSTSPRVHLYITPSSSADHSTCK